MLNNQITLNYDKTDPASLMLSVYYFYGTLCDEYKAGEVYYSKARRDRTDKAIEAIFEYIAQEREAVLAGWDSENRDNPKAFLSGVHDGEGNTGWDFAEGGDDDLKNIIVKYIEKYGNEEGLKKAEALFSKDDDTLPKGVIKMGDEFHYLVDKHNLDGKPSYIDNRLAK